MGSPLDLVDYVAILCTLLFSLFVGFYFAFKKRKSNNNEELLTGSRNMPVVPVAASMVVTNLSAIQIFGYPAEVYSFGSQIFLFPFFSFFTSVFGVLVFVSVLYDLKLTSAYNYLEMRYNSIEIRWLASLLAIIQLLLMSGIVMYAPALVLETMMGLPRWKTVAAIAISSTIYTSIGGIRAVVWSDIFQFVCIIGGLTAIFLKATKKAGGFAEAMQVAKDAGRLQVLDFTVDPFMRLNTLNIFLGFFSFDIYFAVAQPVVQRYCGLSTFRNAVKSHIWSYFFGIFTTTLMMMTGVVIFAAYSKCDPVSHGDIQKTDHIVPYFVVEELSLIPGMLGLFAAVVFCAVLSTISSTLNSLAAVTLEDFLVKVPAFRKLSEVKQAVAYKLLTIVYAMIIVFLAFEAENFGTIIQAAVTVSTIAISINGSVFLMGVLAPFVNKCGAGIGMIASIVTMSYISINGIILQTKYRLQPMLPFRTDGCPPRHTFMNETFTLLPASELEFPEKLLTVSFVLYPAIGAAITITVSIFVSLMTNGIQQAGSVKPEYLHRLVRPKRRDVVTKQEQNQDSAKSYGETKTGVGINSTSLHDVPEIRVTLQE